MATTTFSGPVKAGTINNTTGTTVGTNVANTGFVLMAQSANVVFEANGTTALTLQLLFQQTVRFSRITVDVTTAFDAASTNTLDLGDGSTADQCADALALGSLTKLRVLATSDVSQIGNLIGIGTSGRYCHSYFTDQTGTVAAAGACTV